MRERIEKFRRDQSGALRLALIGVLTLLLLIPLAMVEDLIGERSYRHREVLADIAGQHGGEQRLVGPVLAVPYVYSETRTERVKAVDGDGDGDGETTRERTVEIASVAVIMPERLAARANLRHELRRRGIYEAPVYAAEVTLDGAFMRPDLGAAIPNLVRVDWGKAAVIVGLSDLAGLAAAEPLETAEGLHAFEPGAPAFAAELIGRISQRFPNAGERGYGGGRNAAAGFFHAPLALRADDVNPTAFKTSLKLNGSGGLFLAPVARNSAFEIAGDWPHPSFQGAPLPAEREITDAGFAARWRIPSLARGYGAVWLGERAEALLADASQTAVGFRHARPDDFYVAATRAVNYGVLFVSLTFLACFVLERFGGRALHPAQYGLVGLSLALFYLLLIALAEHIGLGRAYLAAATTIAGLNGLYVGAALRSAGRGLGAAGCLALLYAAFYVMLESEDNALLIGAGLLLAGLAGAMAATARMARRDDPADDAADPQPVRG